MSVVRDGHKWCTGHCGRWLPVTDFYRATRGGPQGKCKSCHRITARENARKVGRRPGVLVKRAKAAKAKWWADGRKFRYSHTAAVIAYAQAAAWVERGGPYGDAA